MQDHGILSQLSDKCRQCPKVDECDHKVMQACAYIVGGDMLSDVAQPSKADMVEPMLKEERLVNVKVAEGMTVMLDLNELARRMKADFYRGLL